MRCTSCLAALTLLLNSVLALPPDDFVLNHEAQAALLLPKSNHCETASASNRVAIIGAGAAGSSAAFWIAKAQERYGIDVEVDVYDKNGYIGGRSTVVQPYGMPELDPIELGGTVFVEANKNLWRATDEFGFERVPYDNASDTVGIWDGREFALTIGGPSWYSDILTKAKVIFKYGIQAPLRTQKILKRDLIDPILSLYAPTARRFRSIEALALHLNWTALAGKTMAEHMDLNGINPAWTREMVEGVTRFNYAQNVDRIHAVEGLVSLAAARPSSVKGGNHQIFERFLAESKATLFLDTAVESVSRASPLEPWLVKTKGSDDERAYRAVILAAPFHQANIAISSPELPIATVPEQPYVHLHVTLLTTSSPHASSAYFNLPLETPAPEIILTTSNATRNNLATGQEPAFNMLSYLTQLRYRNGTVWLNANGQPEWVVKIFSNSAISDDVLRELFDGKLGWVVRKEWDPYPVLPPTTEFPPVELADGLYYVNAFEPLISTLETETLASRNVVDLLLHDHFRTGLCMTHTLDAPPDSFVYGWDC
ncbi:FAD/NAD(P)-binding domain-containing protein [Trametes coccinea BRFM310]|uniref:FAD/NAD(P)-binding domain-containing protein n=1 Tax=Trametes coccinea (strain BRFM310) TaxID=1353009 RepID=A0A1Y2IEA5_TRAC3|nr:FAD/NAD(P)-binding domain-containing protein [Trametes coccinea BRFM310]